MRNLNKIKNIVTVTLGLLLLCSTTARAETFFGRVSGSPDLKSLNFVSYVDNDDSFIITDQITNGYQLLQGAGWWIIDTDSFRKGLTAKRFDIDFYNTTNKTIQSATLDIKGLPAVLKDIDQLTTASLGVPKLDTPAVGDSKVGLSWDASGSVSEYKVYRSSSNDGRYDRIRDNLSSTTTSYTDSGLQNGVAYYYTIVAVDSNGNRVHSNLISATPQIPVVVPVVKLESIELSPQNITVKVGENKNFKLKANYSDSSNSYIDSGATWQIIDASPKDLGSINNGVLKTAKIGTGKVTASYGGKTATALLTVVSPINKVAFNYKAYMVDKQSKGKTVKISPEILDSEGLQVDASKYQVAYSVTGKENIIDINGNLKPGNTDGQFLLTSTVNVGGKDYVDTATVYINVNDPKITTNIKEGQTINPKHPLKVEASDGNGIASITVKADGKELASKAGASALAAALGQEKVVASFVPDKELTAGSHTIVIEVKDSLGGTTSVSYGGLQVYGVAAVTGTPMNYPNPFKPSSQLTTINYTLTQDTNVKFYIYDLARQTIYSADYAGGTTGGSLGENEITWNGRDAANNLVANGVYVYFITLDGKILGSGEISVYE
ncbi:hypothetical protein A2291_08135 [candidate division WOR-1 bacterium RIFOXYB2_FULL_42_35]|uniref:Fibronectin type-III domain-containing protein n=1 Tax=candidate division WOR-1 bacterium RIFOXYC2_FULL_41_25 TaxID=1802586 RepID=A0A1F4TID1_UNCSA|nr:MAG: hypothetical protein A2247_01820 [candidate division WOR-1 bacterium RIFOXYA2_FULL_41_14]OGC24055.1 MAG: hypothetical protein A2291_08135 [candidate division WOR-1 bacterium RIFOXYB2_FULL_42_35]OGC32478.1 MAG: hypothetical protein A2462_00230 [candidate division WOR-1 bacterium RIFOXYC2_FULL_41_25]OGC41324.1 MAG: hypothetical protein A2548_00490 [candidate division WOR-1 bacterium RIFOXYD2_FULL_41_8]